MSTPGQTPEELRKDVDATRRELGATVEALAAKTAIKARLHDRVEHVKDDLKRTLERRSVQAVTIASTAIVLVTGWTLLRRTD
jgi:DNA replication initiation complex subunit (GINS family)